MKDIKNGITFVASSSIRKEIESLQRKINPFINRTVYIDSMMLFNPHRSQSFVKRIIDNELRNDRRVLLICGECSSLERYYKNNPDVRNVRENSLIEVLIGKNSCRLFRDERYCLLLPEWALRWQELLFYQMKLNNNGIKNSMQNKYQELIYLDTGVISPPYEELINFSIQTGLGFDIIPVKLDRLFLYINEQIKEFSVS